jgi:hypothetical protein
VSPPGATWRHSATRMPPQRLRGFGRLLTQALEHIEAQPTWRRHFPSQLFLKLAA